MIEKYNLANACTSIFDLGDKQFSLSVISVLYDMAGESRIPINIVNDVVRIPDYIANDKMLCIQYTHITKAVLITI